MGIYLSLVTILLLSSLSVSALATVNSTAISKKTALVLQPSHPAIPDRSVSAAVNINTADIETLIAELTGIGSQRAQAIIAYREKHGPFKSIDDLVNIKGISKKILEKNRNKLSV